MKPLNNFEQATCCIAAGIVAVQFGISLDDLYNGKYDAAVKAELMSRGISEERADEIVSNKGEQDEDCDIRPDHIEAIRRFNVLAGNTDDRFNVRQVALYFGLQLEEMAEKLETLGLLSLAEHIQAVGRKAKAGNYDFNFELVDRLALLDDDIDQFVVTVGSLLSQGVDIHGAIAEVNRANLAKVYPDGTLHKNENGKIIKPDGWVGPDLAPFVRKE